LPLSQGHKAFLQSLIEGSLDRFLQPEIKNVDHLHPLWIKGENLPAIGNSIDDSSGRDRKGKDGSRPWNRDDLSNLPFLFWLPEDELGFFFNRSCSCSPLTELPATMRSRWGM